MGKQEDKRLVALAKKREKLEEERKALNKQEAEIKKLAKRKERIAAQKVAKSFRSKERRGLVLAGAWLFNEFLKGDKGNENGKRLERYFVGDVPKFLREKDRDFMREILPDILELRSRASEKEKKKRPSDDEEKTIISNMTDLAKP
jgi:hypothetical protein